MGSYYDIDAILTDAQKMPCTFDLDLPGLGYLDENAGGDVLFPSLPILSSYPFALPIRLPMSRFTRLLTIHPQVKAGTRVSLPLWLSTMLAVQRLGPSSQTLCTLDLPASISPRVLAALKAGPKTVDLRQLASHYYELAARVLELFEEEEVVDVLSEVRMMTALPEEKWRFKGL